MEKLMPLDLLSSIKGAESSEAVSELFEVIKKAVTDSSISTEERYISHQVRVEELRDDVVASCPDEIKNTIRNNFPEKKNGYLVVPKVIEE